MEAGVKGSIRYTGPIIAVRAVEDSIRATRQYTEGIFTRWSSHPTQGQDFPSRVFIKHYEVYPNLDLNLRTSLWETIDRVQDWLWRDTLCVTVLFHYDYRSDRATAEIRGGSGMVDRLRGAIPGFGEALAAVDGTGGEL